MSNKEHIETLRSIQAAYAFEGGAMEAAIRALEAEDAEIERTDRYSEDDRVDMAHAQGFRAGARLTWNRVTEAKSRYRALVEAANAVRYADNDDDEAHDALYAALDALEE